MSSAPTCSNCGQPLCGAWCHACGQQVLGPAQRGLGSLLGEFWVQLSSLESRWWRSFAVLMFQPGRLSADWLAGRRKRWLSPLSLFLLCNLLYFLAGGLSDFNLSLDNQLCLQPYSAWIRPWIDAALGAEAFRCDAPHGPAFAALSAAYAGHATDVAKSLIILHVPLLALPLWLANRGRPWFYAEHLGVALHLFAVLLLYSMVLLPALSLVLPVGSAWFVAALQMPLLLHWLVSLRASYGWSWPRAAALVPILFVTLLAGHLLYRGLQFGVSWWLV